MDGDKVYPIILDWKRKGYNVYIDLEFEDYSSDVGWVFQMKNAIKNFECVYAVCFYSENYTYSYAALMELCTLVEFSKNKKMAIDIVQISDALPEGDFSCPGVTRTYVEKFKRVNNKILTIDEEVKWFQKVIRHCIAPEEDPEIVLEDIIETARFNTARTYYIGIANRIKLLLKNNSLDSNFKYNCNRLETGFKYSRIYNYESNYTYAKEYYARAVSNNNTVEMEEQEKNMEIAEEALKAFNKIKEEELGL